MNTNTLVIALITLVIGGAGGYLIGSSPKNEHMMPDGTQMHGGMHSGMQREMDSMMAALDGKTGDEFDKAFLSEMIMHHEGAVDMAEAALQNAKHAEIKTMANAIISAQTSEIQQMKDWQKNWYGN
ncbi:MAG: DUF305 domain-containing protein [Patescibacteria group bacterium]